MLIEELRLSRDPPSRQAGGPCAVGKHRATGGMGRSPAAQRERAARNVPRSRRERVPVVVRAAGSPAAQPEASSPRRPVRWRWLSVTCLLRRFPPPTRPLAAARDADAPESGWWR
jgi:hypothetical protein